MLKVILYDNVNAFITPGGKTILAVKLQKELLKLGVDVEFSRWWDKSQEDFDIIHILTPDPLIAKVAKEKGKKVFCSLIFDFESNKSPGQKIRAKLKNLVVSKFPELLKEKAYWECFKYTDKIHFMNNCDQENALDYFKEYISKNQTVVIPHGYEPNEIDISQHLSIKELNLPEKYLVSCANISSRKQSVKLAKYAKVAKVPIVFIGNSTKLDPYYQSFEKEIDNKYVFYIGFVDKEWKDCIESNAAGFVLFSSGESGCIAVYEAAAYGLPILLSNLPWAWGYDSPENISFCDINDEEKAIYQLIDFYNRSNKLNKHSFKINTWNEIAKLFLKEYQEIIN